MNKEPWKGSKLADFILVSIPMVIFAAQLVYYLFSEDCTFGVLELGNDKIDLSDDPNCISTPVKQSINFIYTSFSANIFLSMDEIDVQNCVEQLYLNATVTTSIIHVGNETNLYAFWLYGNTGNQIFEIEAILNRWNTSNTFLDSGNEDIYLWFSAQMLCYYASDEWNEPYQCDRCVSYGPIESIALSLPITSYAVTAVILMIQFLYPRCCPNHIESRADKEKRTSTSLGLPNIPEASQKDSVSNSEMVTRPVTLSNGFTQL